MNKRTLCKAAILAIVFGLLGAHSAAAQERKAPVKTRGKNAAQSGIAYRKLSGKAVLIGEEIHLLDKNYQKLKDISHLSGHFAKITAVSKDYHKQNPKDDFCESFKYVKIKIDGLEGIVDGRKVYRLLKNKQGISREIEGSKITLTATKNFGVDVMEEEGLTGCSAQSPAVFSDERAKYVGLVYMKRNEFYNSDYPYFELKDDNEAADGVMNIEKQGNYYPVLINRISREGIFNLLIRIGRTPDGKYMAEIVKKEPAEE